MSVYRFLFSRDITTTITTYVQGIYNYVPTTNYVSKVHIVAAVLWLHYMLPPLYSTSARPALRVQCPVRLLFCDAFVVVFWTIFRWFQLPFVITGITFVVTFHMRCISVVRSLSFRIFSAAFLITLQAPEIGTPVSSLFIITVYAVRLIVSGGSVSVQVMIPSSGSCVTLMTWFCWFCYMLVRPFLV